MLQNLSEQKIFLTGGYGFLGSNIYNQLLLVGFKPEQIFRFRSSEIDLKDASRLKGVLDNFTTVIHSAAKVGGIEFNRTHPGESFYDNAIMGLNLIEQARLAGIKKFVQVGSVCAYPKVVPIPTKEEDLWSGYPEETNAPYGLAKKILLVQLQSYRQQYGLNGIYLLPVNLYGPGDNFNPQSSHVIPALIRKFTEAIKNNVEEVVVWGTGSASREFLYVEDAARGVVLALLNYDKPDPVNLGSSFEITIKELAELIKELTGYKGNIIWDTSKPDGQPRRKFDTSKAKNEFGFASNVTFKEGLIKTIEYFKTFNEN
jgi:GDP-L-fucose synthase